MPTVISIKGLSKTYATGVRGAEADRPRDREGRDFRPARPQRRRQDDADRIVCGIVTPSGGTVDASTATTSSATIAPRGGMIGLVPQELHTDAFETRDRDGDLQPRPVRLRAQPGADREDAQGPVAVGQAQGADHGAFRRHEAPGDDRQGAVATSPRSCSSTSPPPASTSSFAATCGSWSASCATAASPSSSPPIISRRPRRWPTGSGVINKGELILVEEKTSADEEARQEGADPQPRRAAGRRFRRSSPTGTSALKDDGHELLYAFDANAERTGVPSLLAADERPRHRLQGSPHAGRARSRTSSSAWCHEEPAQ